MLSTDHVRGYANEAEMKIAMNNDTLDKTLLGLLFSSAPKNHSLEYRMRWRDSIEMNTDQVFSETSRPRNVNGPSSGEENYLWPLMYSIFIEHLKFFGVSSGSGSQGTSDSPIHTFSDGTSK